MAGDKEASRAADAEVAEKVMGDRWLVERHPFLVRRTLASPADFPGWPLWDGVEEMAVDLSIVDRYTTDPAADYLVLVKVRETWGLGAAADRAWAFQDALQRLWLSRRPKCGAGSACMIGVLYRPGDYSRAALSALRGGPSPGVG